MACLPKAFPIPTTCRARPSGCAPRRNGQDGKPVTPEDVIFSFDKTKELNPLTFNYYKHVVKAEKTGERDVTFTFDEKNNKELPNILGQLTVVPKHWWEGTGPDGKPRDITKTTLEPVMGSGPYKIAAFSPGATIRYELRDDYWGKDLNVNVGQNNFGSITYTYYGDRDVEFEAFRAGNSDYWQETWRPAGRPDMTFPPSRTGASRRKTWPTRCVPPASCRRWCRTRAATSSRTRRCARR
jgi:microcin C transport system substrate-binding protein